MDTLERVLRLIRMAKDNPNDGDGRALLESAEELLAEVVSPGRKESAAAYAASLPAPIYAIYKRKKYEARLLPGWKVQRNGELFKTPSRAATAITDTQVNGWRFWRYIGEGGKEFTIDHLRG